MGTQMGHVSGASLVCYLGFEGTRFETFGEDTPQVCDCLQVFCLSVGGQNTCRQSRVPLTATLSILQRL